MILQSAFVLKRSAIGDWLDGRRAELLGVLRHQSLPPGELHGIGASNAPNRLTREVPLQHVEADVPAGGAHEMKRRSILWRASLLFPAASDFPPRRDLSWLQPILESRGDHRFYRIIGHSRLIRDPVHFLIGCVLPVCSLTRTKSTILTGSHVRPPSLDQDSSK